MGLTLSKPAPSRCYLVGQFIAQAAREVLVKWRRTLTREQMPYVGRAEYRVPDSVACRKALEVVTGVSPQFLLNHCLRTHAFAVGLAHKVERKVDPEVLFLGCVMHDLGLTEAHDRGDTFELDGARAAHSHCLEHGLSRERADLVHEMVALHNSVGIAHRGEPEVALTHFGAGLDVLGIWVHELHRKTLEEVLEDYPRAGFGEGMAQLIDNQTRRKPLSYMTPLVELGFLDKLRNTQLPGEIHQGGTQCD